VCVLLTDANNSSFKGRVRMVLHPLRVPITLEGRSQSGKRTGHRASISVIRSQDVETFSDIFHAVFV
jgi:hypothetical protein